MNSDLPVFDLGEVSQVWATLHQALALITARMQTLDDQGMVNAVPHWRKGRYLYLVHPQVQGDRKREYVGVDPGKVSQALARVANYQEYKVLEARAREQNERVEYLRLGINALVLRARMYNARCTDGLDKHGLSRSHQNV